MDWDKLRVFHAVAEAGSFPRAGDALNLSQSAVMYHFVNKNALFGELVNTITRHNHETVNELADIKDDAGRRLLKHCIGNVMWARRYKQSDAQILILLYYMSCHVKVFASLFAQMIRVGRERLTGHLLSGVREGLFKLSGSPETVAIALQDSLFGAMLYAASGPEESGGQAALEARWRLTIAALTGWNDPAKGPVIPAEKK